MSRMRYPLLMLLILVSGACFGHAQLSVIATSPKQAGQRAIVKLTLKNTFTEKIESARATVFLMDDQGKMIGQGTRWVIGGTKDRPALKPDKETTFNLVVERRTSKGERQAPAQLNAKVVFTRLVLEGGKSVDPNKNVQIQQRGD